MKTGFLAAIFWVVSSTAMAAGAAVPLQHIKVDLTDKAALQRGAKTYMNYCSGCHSMSLVRYETMGHDIGLIGSDGNVAKDLLQDNLIFSNDNIFQPMQASLPIKDAEKWFGNPPPDLSLTARVHGVSWLYTYLHSFYTDPARPWGVNNLVFPNVAMPNVLESLQGIQDPIFKSADPDSPASNRHHPEDVASLELVQQGTMSPAQFDATVKDLVTFLAYMGEPHALERQHIGKWVIAFLLLLAVLAYFLKKEYWKDVH